MSKITARSHLKDQKAKFMRIESLHFKNITEGWELAETTFDDLNLLVGVSGAGKTQTLDAIKTLVWIALGESELDEQLEWKMSFSIEGDTFLWDGMSEKDSNLTALEGPFTWKNDAVSEAWIHREKLSKNDKVIFDRSDGKGSFLDTPLPKLEPKKSLVALLFDEPMPLIKSGFSQVFHSAATFEGTELPEHSKSHLQFLSSYGYEILCNSMFHPMWKAYFASEYSPEDFDSVKRTFSEIFPQVADVAIDLTEAPAKKTYFRNDERQFFPEVRVQMSGATSWTPENGIASGMLKTFHFICESRFFGPGMVFLIDEFENSLGVNCLDVVTDLLLERQDTQFILTSHHPYVINKIPMKYWRIVTRKGGVIHIKTAEDLHLGKSKHEAFIQLINSEDYMKGVAAS